jgi:hypothetical protein
VITADVTVARMLEDHPQLVEAGRSRAPALASIL